MRIRCRAPACTAVVLALLCGAGGRQVAGQEFQVDRGAQNVVRFVSSTQVDEFEGVTSGIDGYVLLDGEPLTDQTGGEDTELYVEVELAGLDTGIGLRNRHMRDNYLEVEQFPYASFEGRITGADVAGDGHARITATGTFTVHGVPREREIVCDVVPTGPGYRSTCSFQVLLSDHDIDIPRVMFLKLANEIQVELEFTVSPAGGRPGGNP